MQKNCDINTVIIRIEITVKTKDSNFLDFAQQNKKKKNCKF